MMDRLIQYALSHRLLVLLFLIGVIFGGIYSFLQLPIDAFPDISPNVVQVFTEAPGLAPEEVEKLITFPIEKSMMGISDVTEVKSITQFGLSAVSVYFKQRVNIYFARQLILERLSEAEQNIPEGFSKPSLGPITTGLGQIYRYQIKGEGYSLMELREIEDWLVKPQLQIIPGVAEVLSFGGLVRQYQVLVNPDKLYQYGITLDEVVSALEQNNRSTGGSFLEEGAEEYLIRSIGFVQSLDDIKKIKVCIRNNIPIFIEEVAEVQLGSEIRRGVVTSNGKGEIVSAIVMKLKGENTSQVLERVNAQVMEINKILPPGVNVIPFYDQGELVAKATKTVFDALRIGILLIVLVIFAFLGNIRAAFIVVLALPFSLFASFILMRFMNMSANLMSLGGLAIGIGMLVDGAIVMVENIHRTLNEKSWDKSLTLMQIIRRSAHEVGKPILFALSIIVIVFLPMFSLQGVEGILFSPLALTISFALLGSLIFAIVITPVLSSFLFKKKLKHHENRSVKALQNFYLPLLELTFKHSRLFVFLAVMLLVWSIILFFHLGREFVPELNEGAIDIRVTMAPNTALDQAQKIITDLEKRLIEFEEVESITTEIGRAEVGGEPEQINNAELVITLKPRNQWQVDSKENLVEKMETAVADYPGVLFSFSQPINMRVDELVSGVKAQIAIKLFGDDINLLNKKAQEISQVISAIHGARDVQVEQTSGRFYIQIVIDRAKIASYGLNVDEVNEIVETAIGGKNVSEVFEGDRRFSIFIRYQKEFRKDVQSISNLLITSPDGQRIPLGQVTAIKKVVGPNQISRDSGRRRIVVQLNIRGRDMGSFVQEAQHEVARRVKLPPGYYVVFGGEFENQQRAMKRLSIILPVTIFLIFLMLYQSFTSFRYAGLVIMNLPFAVIGGVLGLWITGEYISVPSAIGFIALFGIAVENGIVMITIFNQLRRTGRSLLETILEGARLRLRPVLMTASTTTLGLIPLLLSQGIGSEVQRPLAVVVTSGVTTATVATLFILPILYYWLEMARKPAE
jgi:cobalt-zinc-cadmium resistance protein CzcA